MNSARCVHQHLGAQGATITHICPGAGGRALLVERRAASAPRPPLGRRLGGGGGGSLGRRQRCVARGHLCRWGGQASAARGDSDAAGDDAAGGDAAGGDAAGSDAAGGRAAGGRAAGVPLPALQGALLRQAASFVRPGPVGLCRVLARPGGERSGGRRFRARGAGRRLRALALRGGRGGARAGAAAPADALAAPP